jgi:hypothetical protein
MCADEGDAERGADRPRLGEALARRLEKGIGKPVADPYGTARGYAKPCRRQAFLLHVQQQRDVRGGKGAAALPEPPSAAVERVSPGQWLAALLALPQQHVVETVLKPMAAGRQHGPLLSKQRRQQAKHPTIAG